MKKERLGFPGGLVGNLPATQEMQETCFWFLGQEDSLEEGMATHSSILAWRLPWMEEPGELQSMGSQKVGLTEQISKHSTAFWFWNFTLRFLLRQLLSHI